LSLSVRIRRELHPNSYQCRTSYADSGFEPVSAETQPVSGRLPIQISDIENHRAETR
jgi:hypothetical protein